MTDDLARAHPAGVHRDNLVAIAAARRLTEYTIILALA
jgi:hypothetical protein